MQEVQAFEYLERIYANLKKRGILLAHLSRRLTGELIVYP